MASALLPLFVLIAAGALLHRLAFADAGLWTGIERLVYFLFFPALMVDRLWQTPVAAAGVGTIALTVAAGWLAVAALVLAANQLLRMDGPDFTSVFQGAVRGNTYVGLALAAGLLGDAGFAIASLAFAVIVPLVNVLSVAVLASHGGHTSATPWMAMASIARNPLVLACVAGATLSAAAIPQPDLVHRTLELLGRPALPLGLLTVGAALQFTALGHALRPLALSSAFKLVLMPLLVRILCHWLAVDPLTTATLTMLAALPTATSSYILARQLGGNAPLMALVISCQTVAAALTLPLVHALLVPA